MGNFDKKGHTPAESDLLDRDTVPRRPSSGSRPLQSPLAPTTNNPDASAPFMEVGDPITYDPTLHDSDSFDMRASAPMNAVPADDEPLPGSVSPSLDWRDTNLPESVEEAAGEEEEEHDPYLGATISDRYVVEKVIGEGGMGRVYLARHKIIGKRVAIKILHAELARDKEAVGRFVREARAASSVGNPHIVDIADFGETVDGSTYFVMEYLDGVTLSTMLEEKRSLDADFVCNVSLQIADGLAAAHRQQIVHRDLKPDNITLVKQGQNEHFAKILDFGIAKVSTSSSSTKLTMAGAVFGTPHYMSPEQAAGAAVDHRTDIYSLGVIMYELTSGELPFHADNFMGILTQHMYKAPVPIRAIVGAPECSPGLEALILKCLSKKPDARYATMDELAADIKRVQAGEVPMAVHDMMARSGSFNVPADYFQTGPALPAAPQGKRRRLRPAHLAMFAGITVAVGLVLFVLLKNNLSDAQPPAPTAAGEPKETASASDAAAQTVDVMLASNAPAATAFIDGVAYALPKLLAITKGKPLSVRVAAEGFADKLIDIDGSEREVKVIQEARAAVSAEPTPRPSAVSSGTRPPQPAPVTKPPPGRKKVEPPALPKPVDGVIDPWEKK